METTMSEKKTNVPKIRFPGFTEAWERRRLKDIVARVTRKNKDLESLLPLTISAEDGLIGQTEFFNKTVASRDVSSYYLVKKGEFAYNKSYSKGYPWGAVKRLDRYDMGVLSTLYIVFKPTNIDSDFLAKYYDTSYWFKEVSKHAAEGARNHGLLNITASDFFEIELTIPSDKKEQIKIGAFFKSLDHLITLQQRKLDHLHDEKKSLLQKMFPKKGESVPEIRFPGFTQPWEQRKLGEISESLEYGLNASATAYDGTNKYIRITDIDDVTREFKTDSLTSPNADSITLKNYKLQEGDVLFARTGASVGKTYRYKKSDGVVYYAGFLIRMRVKPGFDSEFIFQSTLTSKYNNFIRITSQRSGQPGVNAQEYAEFRIMVPKLAEQRKIGTFLADLDHLITLQQRKLDHCRKLKKGLLQQMFV